MTPKGWSWRRSWAVATTLAGAVALVGCVPTESTVVTLLVWDGGQQSTAAFETAAEGFTEANPGVVVEIEVLATADYDAALGVRLAGGEGPDVYGARAHAIPDLIAAGRLAPVQDEPWFLSLTDSARSAPGIVQDDQAWAFPLTRTGEGLIVNTALLERVGITRLPTTYRELVAACEALAAAGITPLAMSAQDAWWPQSVVYQVAVQQVDPGFDDRRRAGEATFADDEGWRRTLEIWQELQPFFVEDPLGTSQAVTQSRFLAGEIAMFPASWILPEARRAGLEVDYLVLPANQDPVAPVWGSYPMYLGINPEGGQTDAAARFVAYLLSDAAYPAFVRAQGTLPVRDGVDVSAVDPLFATMLAAWDGRQLLPSPTDTWPAGVQPALLAGLQRLTAGEAGVADVLAAMDAAYAG